MPYPSKPLRRSPRSTTLNPRLGSLRPLLLLMTGLIGCAHASVAPPAPSTPATAPTSTASPALFTFHFSSWINLHQELYFEAHPPPGKELQRPEEERWTPAEQQAWDSAVAAYREHSQGGPIALLYEPTLVSARLALEGVPENGSVEDLPGLDPTLAAALQQAIGPYRAHFWPEVEREAHAWVAALEPDLNRLGQDIAHELSEAYGVPWPLKPFPVQVSRQASRFGAYTLVDPTVITISDRAPVNRQALPLEGVFHEASHALMDPLMSALATEFRRQGRAPPEGLWHALLFFTTGEVVRHHLGPSYVPYASLNGLYARDPAWAAFEPVMKREWTPYLEHRVDLQTALRQLVAGYVPPAPPPHTSNPEH